MRVANNKLVDGQNQIEDIVDNLKQNARSKLLEKFGLKDGDEGLQLDVPDVPQAISSAVDNVASKVSSYAEEGLNNGLGKLATSVLGPYKEGAIGSRGTRVLGDMLNRLKNPEETLNTIKDQLGQQPRSFIKQAQSQASEIQENINNQISNIKSSVKLDPNSILSDEQKQMISKAQDAASDIVENASETLNKGLVGNVAKDTAKKVGEDVAKDVGEDVAESAAEDVGSSLLDFLLPGIGVAISAGIMGGQIHKLVEEAHKHGNFNPTSASYQIGS